MRNLPLHPALVSQPPVVVTVEGEYGEPRGFTFAELIRLRHRIVERSQRLDGELFGAPLTAVVEPLRIKLWAKVAVVHGADGFVANIPVANLHDCILAYALDGRPLPAELGGPVRLLAPGLGRCAHVKGVARIVLAVEPVAVEHPCRHDHVRSAAVFPRR